jgi:hypothetical protein
MNFSRSFPLFDCDMSFSNGFQKLLENLPNDCVYRYRYSNMDIKSFDLGNAVTEELRSSILDQFYHSGFVIIELPKSIKGSEAVSWIENEFCLGNPFVPDYFGDYHNNQIRTHKGINRISTANKKTNHNSFNGKHPRLMYRGLYLYSSQFKKSDKRGMSILLRSKSSQRDKHIPILK